MQRHYRQFGERFRYAALPPPNRVLTAAEILTDTGRFDEVMKLAATYARDYPRIDEQIVNAAGYAQLRRGQLAVSRGVPAVPGAQAAPLTTRIFGFAGVATPANSRRDLAACGLACDT